MPTFEARGIEIAWSERGEGPPVLLIHETAATGTAWGPVAEALAGQCRAISYDRRGWGTSSAPEEYRRTTVEEQSEDAAALIEAVADARAAVCGAGIGAVVALDLLLRRTDLVSAAVLIEPPLFQFLPAATEALSQDRHRLEIAAGTGEDVIELYLLGALPALGPGVDRIGDPTAAAARERPASVVAELGIAAGWRMPLSRLSSAGSPSAIVTSGSTPPLLREASEALTARLAQAERREVDAGEESPQLGAAGEIASIVLELTR